MIILPGKMLGHESEHPDPDDNPECSIWDCCDQRGDKKGCIVSEY